MSERVTVDIQQRIAPFVSITVPEWASMSTGRCGGGARRLFAKAVSKKRPAKYDINFDQMRVSNLHVAHKLTTAINTLLREFLATAVLLLYTLRRRLFFPPYTCVRRDR